MNEKKNKQTNKKRKTTHKYQESQSVLMPRKNDVSLELNKAVLEAF